MHFDGCLVPFIQNHTTHKQSALINLRFSVTRSQKASLVNVWHFQASKSERLPKKALLLLDIWDPPLNKYHSTFFMEKLEEIQIRVKP